MVFFDANDLQQLQADSLRAQADYDAQAGATQGQADSISALAAHYPFMAASTMVPLALGGVKPGDPVATAAAQAEVHRKSTQGFGWHSFGDVIKAAVGVVGADPQSLGKVAGLAGDAFGATGIAGAVRSAGSAAAAAGGAVLPDQVGQTLNAGPVKGFVRGAAMGLDALPQAIQGEFRNNLSDGKISLGETLGVLDPTNLDFSQSDAGQGLQQIIEHRGLSGLDYGSGFFAGGTVRSGGVQARRAAAPASEFINGHAPTLGRYYGAKVFEPGTRAYGVLSGLVDGSVMLAADPTTWMGGGESTIKALRADDAAGVARGLKGSLGAGGVRDATTGAKSLVGEASNKFVRSGVQVTADVEMRNAAGLVTGTRNTILPDKAAEWLSSKPGQRAVQHIADSDFTELRRVYGGKLVHSGGEALEGGARSGFEADLLVRLADAHTPQDVINTLGPELGITVRGKPAAPHFPATVRPNLENIRMFGAVPGAKVDPSNIDDMVEQADRFMLNAKFSAADRHSYAEQMARTSNTNARVQVMTNIMDKHEAQLYDEFGVTREKANELSRWAGNQTELFRMYAIDHIGNNIPIPGMMLDGSVVDTASPHLFAESLNGMMTLPDAREIRQVTSRFAPIFRVPGVVPGIAATDFINQQAFKPLVLLRGAWPVKVVGEEQVRMANSGLTSAFLHPFSHIALVTGKKLDTSITGGSLAESEQGLAALSKGSNSLIDRMATRPNMVKTGKKDVYKAGHDGYLQAWYHELADLANDPVGKRVANGGLLPGDLTPNPLPGMDGIKDWLWQGAGRNLRKEAAESRPGLLTQAGSDAQVDTVLQRLNAKTMGDPDLHQLVASGRHGGTKVFERDALGSRSQRQATRGLIDNLAARVEAGTAPDMVKGDLVLRNNMKASGTFGESLDHVTEIMFNSLMSRPTNYLSRSPAFKQFYYRRAEELVQHMAPEAQQATIAAAEAAGVSAPALRRMRAAAARTSGELSLEHADILAKGYAVDSAKKLLYDLHDRSQFFDIARNIMPFGEAWKEVLGVWARIGKENPVALRRAGQLVSGGRNADIDGDGRGILHPDPASGQEMISFPFSQQFTKLVTGVPVPIQGSAQGLNIFSQSVLPGFGPLVAMAAGHLIPDDPTFDGVRHTIIPFGEPDTKGGFVESFMPSWYKKFIQSGYVGAVPLSGRSPSQERAYQNTAVDVMRYLVSTGDYDISNEKGQQQLLKDAKHKASQLYVIRGMAQFVSPTPPTPEFLVQDKDGKAMLAFVMAGEYRKLQQEDYKTATARFIDKFGENAFLATISKSEGGGPVSKAASDFARTHRDEAAAFPTVIAYFSGSKPTDPVDLTAYQRQIDAGTRKTRTPQQAIDLANQRVAGMIYDKAKAQAGDKPTAEGRAWLRTVRNKLIEQYPGYNAMPDNPNATPDLIQSMLRAGKTPALASTDAGQGLALYVQARDKASEAAKGLGLATFSKSPDAAHIRDWLREVADAISNDHPDFAPMFEQVLARELGTDTRGQTSAK